MHFAVVIVESPTGTIGRVQGPWPSFLAAVASTTAHNPKGLHPSENIWLIPLPNETPVLASVVTAAQQYDLPHRVLYFEKPPVEYSFKPRTS